MQQTQRNLNLDSKQWRNKPRRGRQKLPLIPLENVLPSQIAWVSTKEACRILMCDRSQIFRDLRILKRLEPTGLDRTENDIGMSRSTLEVLWEFRKLVSHRGQIRAIQSINQTMRNIYEQRQG